MLFDVRSRLQSSGFEDYLHVSALAGCFEFLYLLAHAFAVSSQELAHRNNDVYFIGAFHQCHGVSATFSMKVWEETCSTVRVVF